jgi:vesicle-associated membrane protein 7
MLYRRVAFSFLEDIKIKFNATYGEKGKTALDYAMNEEFSRMLCKQV